MKKYEKIWLEQINKDNLSREAKIELIKARRRKVLQAKHRRKALRRRVISRLIILSVLAGLVFFFYTKYDKYIKSKFNKDGTESTEVDLFMRENEAKKIALQPSGIDSITIATIKGFSPVSTEGVVTKYIQDSTATYPKR